jgi:inner membrane transporter RhtA
MLSVMTTPVSAPSGSPAAAAGSPAARPGRAAGMALMLSSGLSNQFGAATAALAFPVLGPAGVVAVRQWVAGAVLLTAVRPRFRSFTRQQWGPVIALALIFATMNLSLYLAVDRIGLGLAVTLEFLGPLSVALLASRRAADLGCALIAGAAAVGLARPQPATDYAGVGLALLAAACWAGYILVNRVVGARLPGAQGPAAAAGLSAVLYLPVGIAILISHPPTAAALGRAATAGLLCSAVPMVADTLALRRVPARFFGLFMSVNPVLAALTGLTVLGQALPWPDWLAICAIVAANAVSVQGAGRARPLGCHRGTAADAARRGRDHPRTGPGAAPGSAPGPVRPAGRGDGERLGQPHVPSRGRADHPPAATSGRG